MSEATPEGPAQEPQNEAQPTETAAAETPTTEEIDWKAEARKWEARAKENRTEIDKAAEKARLDAMTESERAVAEAEQRGRTAAAVEFGHERAGSEFIAAAARRNAGFDASKVLEDLNLSRFVDESGKADKEAIAAAVERLVPESHATAPSYDGGSRTTAAAPQGMSQIIRKAAGRA